MKTTSARRRLFKAVIFALILAAAGAAVVSVCETRDFKAEEEEEEDLGEDREGSSSSHFLGLVLPRFLERRSFSVFFRKLFVLKFGRRKHQRKQGDISAAAAAAGIVVKQQRPAFETTLDQSTNSASSSSTSSIAATATITTIHNFLANIAAALFSGPLSIISSSSSNPLINNHITSPSSAKITPKTFLLVICLDNVSHQIYRHIYYII